MNRRDFIKKTAVAGTAIAATSVIKPKNKVLAEINLGKKQKKFPYEISANFNGFDNKNIMFMRMFWDNEKYDDDYINSTYKLYSPMETGVNFAAMHDGFKPRGNTRSEDTLGYRQVDTALSFAGWSVSNNFAFGQEFGIGNTILQTFPINPITGEKAKEPVFVPGLLSWDNSRVDFLNYTGKGKYQFKNKKEASKHVKKAAKLFGAADVGIVDMKDAKKWVYNNLSAPNFKPEPFDMPDGSKLFLPYHPFNAAQDKFEAYGVNEKESDLLKIAGFEPKSCIVLLFAQDYDSIKAAPSDVSDATVGQCYSEMAEVAHQVAVFLRNCGYRALPCGNDTAVSVPLAIEAGLGEGSRMGMLIHEKLGPNLRIAKVFTELELEADKPVTFGVKDFCNVCKKCADACPGNAITSESSRVVKKGDEYDTGKVNKSTMVGVEKWYVNAERCFSFWSFNETACCTCVAVCPYTKIDKWHHDLTKLMTLTPFKPLLRTLDELFGYGGPVDPADRDRAGSEYLNDAVLDFWNK